MRKRFFEILDKIDDEDKLSKAVDFFILALILATLVAVILDSFSDFSSQYRVELRAFEVFSVSTFSIEYLLRVWTSNFRYPNEKTYKPYAKYIFSPMAIVDLLAILPFFIPMLIPIDLRFIRVIRLARLFRVFKLNRYTKALATILKVIKQKKEELCTTLFIMSFIIMIASTLIYYIENPAQPTVFPNIVASFWWAVATLTTVGYGDIYPITALGKILASVISVSGIGIVALPTGIISSGFMEQLRKAKTCKCPQCGSEFEQE